MHKIKKAWSSFIALLLLLATYITANQFTDRDGESYTPPKRKPPTRTEGGASRNKDYGLGLPRGSGTGGGTRNTPDDENKVQ